MKFINSHELVGMYLATALSFFDSPPLFKDSLSGIMVILFVSCQQKISLNSAESVLIYLYADTGENRMVVSIMLFSIIITNRNALTA